ncbi:MAG: voltage-gated chloride channel family protein [Bacteroidota bacterium]
MKLAQPITLIRFFFRWLVICLIVGACAGTASAFFLQTLDWVTHFRETHVWIIAFLPVGGLLIGLLYHYYGKEVNAGNNLLIDTIHAPKQIIPFRMAPFVYIGTMVTHILGGSAGREGTALQMSGAIADQLSKPFHLSSAERKILIIAAIAAGFGSVFGTPFAGIIFSLELLRIGKLKYTAFVPATAAALLADQVTRLWQTPHTHYTLTPIPAVTVMNLFYTVLAGVVFGLCAMIFCKGINISSGLFKKTIPYSPLRPFIGGIIVAAAIWVVGTTKYIGLGIPTIVQSFETAQPAYDFALKILFTIVTLSAGFKGGEVTPLFFIGALLGNALSLVIPVPLSLLTGIGFVAVFAGATNTPIACTIMAIELFGFDITLYAFIACVIAYMVSGNHSIYKQQLNGKSKYNRWKAYLNLDKL